MSNGYAIYAGGVIVADGTKEAATRLERVLTADPPRGIIRHADPGYDRAFEVSLCWFSMKWSSR